MRQRLSCGGMVGMHTGEEYVQLAPGAAVLLRPPHHLQFGMDATVVGVMETPATLQRKLAKSLQRSAVAIKRQDLEHWCVAAGLEPVAATALVEDLLAHGVLQVRSATPAVAMLGNGPIRPLVDQYLRHGNYRQRTQMKNESRAAFLHRLGPNDLTIAFHPDVSHHEQVLALAKCSNVIPVQSVDGKVVIGPIIFGGTGACLACVELHHADVDPHWQVLRKQYRRAQVAFPVLLRAAGTVAAVVASLHSHVASPGVAPKQVFPGQMWRVDAWGQVERTVLRHPRCPVCWEREQG
ncbi:TOMM precursor leader peptide-binding protein [Corynebacterium sp. 35RC1]|nr:TOMM precursor leader peptide-binding protein [Corynebacterium sp. 35RC1]